MWLIMIEALVAFFLLAFIVWWTMYSGREPDPAPPKRHSATAGDKPDHP